jgi:hypothetical protein
MEYKAQQHRMVQYRTLSISSSCFLLSITVEENTTNFTHAFYTMYSDPFSFKNSTFLNVSSADSSAQVLNGIWYDAMNEK